MIELNGKKYYTTLEIAKKVGVTKLTIHRWIKKGKLVPFKFGPKKFYYDEDAVEKCIRGNNNG